LIGLGRADVGIMFAKFTVTWSEIMFNWLIVAKNSRVSRRRIMNRSTRRDLMMLSTVTFHRALSRLTRTMMFVQRTHQTSSMKTLMLWHRCNSTNNTDVARTVMRTQAEKRFD